MKKWRDEDREAMGTVLEVLTRHVGREHAISMSVLHRRVFGETVEHAINDTRRLRTLITELRRRGTTIASTSSTNGGGYYLPRAGSELDDFCQRMRRRALASLALEAKVRRVALPELLGQMQLALTKGAEG